MKNNKILLLSVIIYTAVCSVLFAQTSLLPSEVTLTKATEFPAVFNGKLVGKVKANPGTRVQLVGVDSDTLEIRFRNGTTKVPSEFTNISTEVESLLKAQQVVHNKPLTKKTKQVIVPKEVTKTIERDKIPFVSGIDQIQYPVKDDIIEVGVPEELSNPNIFFPEVKRVVPVVIISFLYAQPDGIHGNNVITSTDPKKKFNGRITHHPSQNPKNETLNLKLSELSKWQLHSYIKGKFGVEESSRFRGYMNPASIPHVGIQVVKHFHVYNNFLHQGYRVDHHKLFEAINLQNLVEELGVKEVWLSAQRGGGGESNMSSPVTGDISNSWQHQDDLPVYNKTYIVYAFPSHRKYDVFLHCRAHQYERMLRFINRKFFNEEFIGFGKSQLIAGNCHHPINASNIGAGKWKHYDYANKRFVNSVVETWIPYTKTPTKSINVAYWSSRVKHLPTHIKLPIATQLNWWNTSQKFRYAIGGGWSFKLDRAESYVGVHASWLIMWSQQFPGEDPIKFRKPSDSFTSYETTNWWDIIYDWDIHASKKLQSTKSNNKEYFGLYKKSNK